MDKSRQQFEEWRSKNKSSTINLFDVWQASRESLEVELPEGFGVHEIWCYTAASVENALISNGVKIKNG
ncbi:hypothetical protein [Providencia rustigianii]|uniref:hypothetical protein n=1 Tax=Providencia rustigianii TaxID=158850 RepID=UPI0038B3695C